MKFKRNEIVSDLCEAAKSSKTGVCLLNQKARDIEVYNFDKVKNIFCKMFYENQKLRSCDVYYENVPQRDYLAIEFKNTSHLRLKELFSELEEKAIDSHMILLETFWKKKKLKQILENVRLLVVYNDALNYGKGVKDICRGFNQVEPIRGNKVRNTKVPVLFENEDEFQQRKDAFCSKFEEEFYRKVEFLDKTQFEQDYIEAGYFKDMTENEIVES